MAQPGKRKSSAEAGHLHLAARRAHEPARGLDERRLPGAVGAQQPDELALADLEVHAAQRLGRAVALAQVADGERGGHPAAQASIGSARDGTQRARSPSPSAARAATAWMPKTTEAKPVIPRSSAESTKGSATAMAPST